MNKVETLHATSLRDFRAITRGQKCSCIFPLVDLNYKVQYDLKKDTLHADKAENIMIKWHRLFGITLTDFLTGTAYNVELEKDLSLKQQLLDVLIRHYWK